MKVSDEPIAKLENEPIAKLENKLNAKLENEFLQNWKMSPLHNWEIFGKGMFASGDQLISWASLACPAAVCLDALHAAAAAFLTTSFPCVRAYVNDFI